LLDNIKDIFKLPSRDLRIMDLAEVISATAEASVCRVLSKESVARLEEGDVVEYIARIVTDEAEEERALFEIHFFIRPSP
jgi:hypothetical protein